MVSVGFLSGLLTNEAPSFTNRFFTSCAWQNLLSTELPALVAHAHRADLVNDLAGNRNHLAVGPAVLRRASAHRLDQMGERGDHVLGLFLLVVTAAEVEFQHRDAPVVDHVGIDLAVALIVGDHLAAAREADDEPYFSRTNCFSLRP